MNAESASQPFEQQPHQEQGRSDVHRAVPRCANCDIDILWTPIYRQGIAYCCTGCAAGGPCSCDYSQYHAVIIAGVIYYRLDD
jgi:hypothetical protein